MPLKPSALIVAGAALLLLTSCGSDATGASTTVIQVGPTNFVTVPPPSTTDPTATTAVPAPGETILSPQTYEIVGGDYPLLVAKKCGVTKDALDAANADTDGYAVFPVGVKINVPAGALIGCTGVVDAPTTTTAVAGGETPSVTTTTSKPAATTTTTEKLEDGACKAVGTYKIVEGDLPSKVATNFDVTVAQLDKANVTTKGYKNFVV
ncbi:unnamed protein product, partial [Phaeothamnion confervicola]